MFSQLNAAFHQLPEALLAGGHAWIWHAGLIWNGEGISAENAGERLFTRSERETLSRFPKTGAILFSIRTYIRPLQTFKQRPSDAARLSQVHSQFLKHALFCQVQSVLTNFS